MALELLLYARGPAYAEHPTARCPKGVLALRGRRCVVKSARAEGLPYQTLISSLLHKYASGLLKKL